MCHASCITFGAINLYPEEVKGKRIIEIGSRDSNGGLRPIIESWEPTEYIGVDLVEGSGVDVICNAEEIVEKFGRESFDAVISTEVLEHVRDWRKVISNIKNICRPEGVILITTRSQGFVYHPTPTDFWRYETEDIVFCLRDCEILVLNKDTEHPGVFVKAKKPKHFSEQDLSSHQLYSMVAGKKVVQLTDKDYRSFHFKRLVLREKLTGFTDRLRNVVLSKI